jgi:uncharacterized short protein YbdD (DUF466 family)
MFWNVARAAMREWTGEAEYERYLRHCAHAPLDPGHFFARRLEERYRTRASCC